MLPRDCEARRQQHWLMTLQRAFGGIGGNPGGAPTLQSSLRRRWHRWEGTEKMKLNEIGVT